MNVFNSYFCSSASRMFSILTTKDRNFTRVSTIRLLGFVLSNLRKSLSKDKSSKLEIVVSKPDSGTIELRG